MQFHSSDESSEKVDQLIHHVIVGGWELSGRRSGCEDWRENEERCEKGPSKYPFICGWICDDSSGAVCWCCWLIGGAEFFGTL